jgi:hypothetical protein
MSSTAATLFTATRPEPGASAEKKPRRKNAGRDTVIELYGKQLRIEFTPAAQRMLRRMTQPLLVELELLFSCFVTKRVHFKLESGSSADAASVQVDFRAVIASTCDLSHKGGDISHLYTPVANPTPYVPSWCRIDYASKEWQGEFGYERARK